MSPFQKVQCFLTLLSHCHPILLCVKQLKHIGNSEQDLHSVQECFQSEEDRQSQNKTASRYSEIRWYVVAVVPSLLTR